MNEIEKLKEIFAYVCKYEHYIDYSKNKNSEASKTQKSGKEFEDYLEKTLEKKLKDLGLKIIKNSSQKHPDFLIIRKKDYKEIKNENNKSIELLRKKGINFIGIECKSTKSPKWLFKLNDTLPGTFLNKKDKAFNHVNEIYFFLNSTKREIVCITTDSIKTKNSLFSELRNEFTKINKQYGNKINEKQKELNNGFKITSFPRPSYNLIIEDIKNNPVWKVDNIKKCAELIHTLISV